jgi:hypothetical protein
LEASLEKLASPTGRVKVVGLEAIISGQKNAFQFPMKLKIARVAKAEVDRGIATVRNIQNSFCPSLLAASSKSSGIDSMNWRIKNMPKALTIPGNIIPQYVSTHFIITEMEYQGITNISVGIMRVLIIIMKTSFFPGKLNFAKV